MFLSPPSKLCAEISFLRNLSKRLWIFSLFFQQTVRFDSQEKKLLLPEIGESLRERKREFHSFSVSMTKLRVLQGVAATLGNPTPFHERRRYFLAYKSFLASSVGLFKQEQGNI